MFVNKILLRFKQDKISTFFYRIVFFFVRQFFEFFGQVKFLFIKKKCLAISKDKSIIKVINGVNMRLNLDDPGISKDLLLLGIREPNNTRLLCSIISDGDVVIDVGANIGYFALLEAKIVGNNGWVYAIEPIPDNIGMLDENIKANGFANISTHEYAIGDETKEGHIYLSHKSNWCSMLKNAEVVDEGRKIPVKVMTLDDFIKEKRFPDLIRMDAEGYEVQIIKGMKGMIESSHPLKIMMEIHCAFINDLGFSLISYLVTNGFEVKLFFRDTPLVMINKPEYVKKIYYWLGRKIGGIYEFRLEDTNLDELKSMSDILKEEVFHIYFERK